MTDLNLRNERGEFLENNYYRNAEEDLIDEPANMDQRIQRLTQHIELQLSLRNQRIQELQVRMNDLEAMYQRFRAAPIEAVPEPVREIEISPDVLASLPIPVFEPQIEGAGISPETLAALPTPVFEPQPASAPNPS